MGFDLAAIRFSPEKSLHQISGFFKVEWSEGDISKTIIFKGWLSIPGPSRTNFFCWNQLAAVCRKHVFFGAFQIFIFGWSRNVSHCVRFGFPAKLKTKASYFVEIRFLLLWDAEVNRIWLPCLGRLIQPLLHQESGPLIGVGSGCFIFSTHRLTFPLLDELMELWCPLGGGFKNFLFSSLPGEMIRFNYFSDGLKPPPSPEFFHSSRKFHRKFRPPWKRMGFTHSNLRDFFGSFGIFVLRVFFDSFHFWSNFLDVSLRQKAVSGMTESIH